MNIQLDLTKNQTLVFDALMKMDEPVSAYTLLDQLREHGIRGPQQVYRALDKLVGLDLVHKLESLNAFIACKHQDCDHHETVAFMICDHCGKVDEIANDRFTSELERLAATTEFALATSNIELRGQCSICR